MWDFTWLINVLIKLEGLRLNYVAHFKTADKHIDAIMRRAGYSRVNGYTWQKGPFQTRLTHAEGSNCRVRLTVVRPEYAQNVT